MPDGEDATAARITTAFADAIRAGEVGDTTIGMPGAWAMVGTYNDADGATRTVFLTPNDQAVHITLGLLAAGREVWGEAMRRWILGNNDDGP